MTIYRDDLERVYALIERPEAWTQKAYARNECGDWVEWGGVRACQWCLEGAMMHVLNQGERQTRFSEIDAVLRPVLPAHQMAANFNDTHTHAEVLALLRSAIERAPVRP